MGLSLWATPLKRVAAVPANAPRPIPQHCCTLELQQEGGAAPPAGAPGLRKYIRDWLAPQIAAKSVIWIRDSNDCD